MLEENENGSNIKIRELKITLLTNIPKESDYEKEILTLVTINKPELKIQDIKPTQLPWFTFDVGYDESIIKKLTYQDIVKTFFDKDLFLNKFEKSSDILIPETEQNYYKERRRIIHKNIMLTLKYLLPTKFPVINNQFNSYDMFKNNDSLNTLLFNPLSDGDYIYLKLSSGLYTLKKAVWLNDFLNNPDYSKKFTDISAKISGSSSNEVLQENIKSFDENTIKEIKRCYEKTCVKPYSDYIYTGIKIFENDPYEIYVDVELLEEELKPEEVGKIKCPYYGEYLGEELTRLLKDSNPRKKPLPGKIDKKPLFSIKTMTSRKIGLLEKLDDKQKLAKIEEDKKYNEIDDQSRQNYEKTMNPFLKYITESKGLIKNNVKKYAINIKTIYLFLDDQNFSELLNYLIEDEEGKNEILKRLFSSYPYGNYSKLKTKIDERIEAIRKEKNRKNMEGEEFNKEKTKFDLTKEFLEYLKNTNETVKALIKPKTGGRSIKKRKPGNKKHTRKHK